MIDRISPRHKLRLGGVALLALGFAAGSGAVSLTRPAVAMAPTVATAVARLPAAQGIVTVKGRVAEVYGDRFVVQDGTGPPHGHGPHDGPPGPHHGEDGPPPPPPSGGPHLGGPHLGGPHPGSPPPPPPSGGQPGQAPAPGAVPPQTGSGPAPAPN